jgi:hypothetical protein
MKKGNTIKAYLMAAFIMSNISLQAQWVQGAGQVSTAKVVIGSNETGEGRTTIRLAGTNEPGIAMKYANLFTKVFAGNLSAGGWGTLAQTYDGGIIFGNELPPYNAVGFVIGPYASPYKGLRINYDGRVQIGECNNSLPAGYNLFVKNGILTEKLKVAVLGTAQWADYVFAKDYKLMPLAKVEQYIKENQHLPNIPSAAEMVKEGNDLGKTTVKLLEKIEELTLYVIQQQKEIESLKKNLVSTIK